MGSMASKGHALTHLPHPTHADSEISALPSSMEMAFMAQYPMHFLHPLHFSWSTRGLAAECISIFPLREPQPMARFLSAPPNPACSWHLKWFRVIMTSASAIARPIFAVSTYSPSTGISTSSIPLRPSAMMIWQPVDMGENPLRLAVSMCSMAFFLLPTYSVLQSVRNGIPPFSFTMSAMTFA